MSSRTHTHRGHCQLCGSIQAIDNGTGRVAKHGYTVDGGYFSGICPGSGELSLHVERALADKHIAHARAEESANRTLARKYEDHKAHPGHVWNGAYTYVSVGRGPMRQVEQLVKWEDATPDYQRKGRWRAAGELIRRADMCASYARDLERQADHITGKVQPYPVGRRLPFGGLSVGDTVRVGGAKGYKAVIEALEIRPLKRWGVTHMVPQAQVIRPGRPAIVMRDGYVMAPERPAALVWENIRSCKKLQETSTT